MRVARTRRSESVIGAGIAAAVAAAVANAFAVVLQAAEAQRAPPREVGRPVLLLRLMRQPRWLAGTGLMVLAWPLQVLSLAFAPITVVQPLLSATNVVLLGVAKVQLREQVGLKEALGVIAIVAGVATVVWAAPRHTSIDPSAGRVAAPLTVVGLGALGAYALGRLRPRAGVSIVIGAGLAYAWADFGNKLLADAISSGRWGLAAVWLAATIGFGALAFLEENSALARRPAITVAPVIGAVQEPLPVLMALWAGVEVWGSSSHKIGPLIGGLALVATGAALLGHSRAVAGVARSTP